MRPKRLAILATAFILATSACGGADPGEETTTSAEQPGTTNSPTGSEDVVLENISFNPDEITVQAGSSVTWTNEDGVSHTATSDDDLWDSDTISSGSEFSFVFDEPGTYTYFCKFHPTRMQGTVIVEG